MFGIADYSAFVVAGIVFLMIPGPGNLALITSTGRGGVRGGLAATLGVIGGDQVLMCSPSRRRLAGRLPPAFIGRARTRLAGFFMIGFGLKLALSR